MRTTLEPRVVSASTLIGDEVKNAHGEHLGHIEEVMLNTRDGKIAYLVLSFGGILGLGDKLFAIPWQAFTHSNTEENVLSLDVEKETLKQAPGFDKHEWPETAVNDYLVDVYSYYGHEPYWEEEDKIPKE